VESTVRTYYVIATTKDDNLSK